MVMRGIKVVKEDRQTVRHIFREKFVLEGFGCVAVYIQVVHGISFMPVLKNKIFDELSHRTATTRHQRLMAVTIPKIKMLDGDKRQIF